jgi:hypothetical protein
MTPKQALSFVKTNGITLESGRGPVPSLAQTIAGEAIRGSWWAHPKRHVIFLCSRAIRESKDVLVCRLVGGKVTYVHRRLWPALVRLAEQFDAQRLAAIREVHTATGKHKIEVSVFPGWVPPKIIRAAASLTAKQAAEMLRSYSSVIPSRADGEGPLKCE